MFRARFLKLAAIATLVVASTAVTAGPAHADGSGSAVPRVAVSPAPGATTTDRASSTPSGTLAESLPLWKVASRANWDCTYGYPCLYGGDYGAGAYHLEMTCGFYDLGTYSRNDGTGLHFNDWANSARTHGNSMTVYNWDGSKWVDWGTVPAWSNNWQFKLVNQIDGVMINC